MLSNYTCKNAFEEDIAIVNFYFDKSTVIQYETSQRMTWFDFFSQVGKKEGQLKICSNLILILKQIK